ncbi:hypothetical protein DACRYDRAFT_21686 [Dacryopinax primogenitus]|uniref:Uncharacterized protein n=1 Tax=Dacryopinax primogenitus (strain DJM 731) TaxID=1858805 RepID=M5GDS7_DACPD|nr:uncharacterized protein DACRYDRAFT_21686 [Dacryopinax primogenitus]EJU02658.1 hypothetical protein DACRYDRAFT_21686 [Dacryopinax primogenitus]
MAMERLWTVQFYSDDDEGSSDDGYVSAITLADKGNQIIFVFHPRKQTMHSMVYVGRREVRLAVSSKPEYTPFSSLLLACRAGDGDLLRHVDYVGHLDGRLICGRKHSFLWFRVPLSLGHCAETSLPLEVGITDDAPLIGAVIQERILSLRMEIQTRT